MRTVRLYVDEPLASGRRLALSSERSRYVTQSLRMPAGATLNLFNETDGEFAARIQQPRKRETVVAVEHPVTSATESPLALTLAQAVGRGERMDYAVQKATELGVRRIQPLLSDRTEVRLSGARAETRLRRWNLVARAACEQCGRVAPPKIAAPLTTAQWLAQDQTLELAIALDPGARDPLALTVPIETAIALAVGPEGGWSDDERAAFADRNFQFARLGPRTLRTETAAAVAVALVQAHGGDLLAT